MDIQREKKSRLLTPARLAILIVAGMATVAFAFSAMDFSTRRIARDEILIGTVQHGDLTITVAANGVLLARDVELLSAKVEGTVSKVLVKPGDSVTEGQALVELDNPLLAANVDSTQFALDAANANLVSSRIAIETQILNQESALVQSRFALEKAKLELEAKRRLSETGVVSRIEFQQIELDVKQKEQLVALEDQRLHKSQQNQGSQLAVLEASLRQAEQNFARAQTDKANLHVRAAMAGVVQELGIEMGQQLRQGEQLGRVARQDVLYAQLNVPSLQAGELAVGQRVELNTRNGVVEGAISRVDPAVVNGTVLVDVNLTSALPASARPELAVEGTIYLAEIHDTLYVQRPAAARTNTRQVLFRLDANEEYAERVNVEIGRVAVNDAQVLDGLRAGDRIILSESTEWQDQTKVLIGN
jgi:multidrug efflux pump subunit AcrA (membrane-fusion protein)